MPYAGSDTVTVPAMLPKLSLTPGKTRWAGPDLGQHTEDILSNELGMGSGAMAKLRQDKVI